MRKTKHCHAQNVDMIPLKLKIWACLVCLFFNILLQKELIFILARSHKFGRQGQSGFDDEDGSYSYGDAGGSYDSYGKDEEDDDEYDDDDGDEEEDDEDESSDESSDEHN